MTAPLPPAWAALVAEVNGRPLAGTPGVRDIGAPCELFDGIEPDGSGDCHGDGHWLCDECSHLSSRSDNWPEERLDEVAP